MEYKDYTLSSEQLELLNSGEGISVDGRHGSMKINPPCEDFEHDWYSYDFMSNQEGGNEIVRRCRNCNERDSVEVEDLDELFNVLDESGLEISDMGKS